MGRDLIRSDGILRQLSDAQETAFTLIRAPAGYGKTSLLTLWATEDHIHRFAWVALDQNDPSLFWRYLLADSASDMLGRPDRCWLSATVSNVSRDCAW